MNKAIFALLGIVSVFGLKGTTAITSQFVQAQSSQAYDNADERNLKFGEKHHSKDNHQRVAKAHENMCDENGIKATNCIGH